jgi:hypothetical protein
MISNSCPYCGDDTISHNHPHKRHPNQQLHKCMNCQCYCVFVKRAGKTYPLSDKLDPTSDAVTTVK